MYSGVLRLKADRKLRILRKQRLCCNWSEWERCLEEGNNNSGPSQYASARGFCYREGFDEALLRPPAVLLVVQPDRR